MIKKIIKLREKFKEHKIDGYIIPKNDEFFSEYAQNDRLKTISNFTGSAGFAIILKKKCYLFVDGRYTIQARMEAGKEKLQKVRADKRKVKEAKRKAKEKLTGDKMELSYNQIMG